MSGSGGGSVSATGCPAKLAVPRPLEECDASAAVQAGREPDGTGAPVEKVRGDRLRDGTATGGDLVEIEVLQVVLEQQLDVAMLSWRVGTSVRSIKGPSSFRTAGTRTYGGTTAR